MKQNNFKMRNYRKKIGTKLIDIIQTFCGSEELKTQRNLEDFKNFQNCEFSTPKIFSPKKEKIDRKWRERVEKTCRDFDSQNNTFQTIPPIDPTVSHNATVTSLMARSQIYRSELTTMKTEIAKLRREKEIIQRGLQTRKSARNRNRNLRRSRNAMERDARLLDNRRFLRSRTDSGYQTISPGSTIYDSNNSNVFYVFL